MRGFLIFMSPKKSDQQYRHPNEAELASEINKARETLSDLISTYTSRLFDFRTPTDVWVDVTHSRKIGMVSGIHSDSHRLIIEEDGEQRGIHELEFHELTAVFECLPKLKKAVIAESIDHLGEIQSAIALFREKVLGVATDDESEI